MSIEFYSLDPRESAERIASSIYFPRLSNRFEMDLKVPKDAPVCKGRLLFYSTMMLDTFCRLLAFDFLFLALF